MDDDNAAMDEGWWRAAGALWFRAGILYFLIAAATVHFASDGIDIATVWPANAVLTAALLLSPRFQWSKILLAGFIANAAANILTRHAFGGPLLYGLSNSVEVLIVALALSGRQSNAAVLHEPDTLTRFIAVAGFVAPLASGVLGASVASLIFGQKLEAAFLNWVLSDALGLLIFTPVFLALFHGDFAQWFRSATPSRKVEAFALLAATAGVAILVFFVAQQPLLFLIYPPVMFITFRVGPLGTKIAVMLVALIGAVATVHGHGPIMLLSSDRIAHAHMFQLFVAVLLLTCLPLAAAVSSRARVVHQLSLREEELSRQAVTDPLTGVYNRSGLTVVASRQPADQQTPTCLAALDVDHFKHINDRWGHAGGDRALAHLATVLRSAVRPDDVICRLGGDEFVLLLPGMDLAQGRATCARVLSELRRRAFSPDGSSEMTIELSCGVATVKAGESLEATLRRADEALYRAKAAGRNAISAAA